MGTQGEGMKFDNTSCVFAKETELSVEIFACIITTPIIIGKRMFLMVSDINFSFILIEVMLLSFTFVTNYVITKR